ncbi:MAG: DUF5990 family protein [Sphingomonas sp.]|uniref:DUF5990 family protein n=1 Tax=Sphingomonas sp. TaxID=28214 RepID=UPI003F7FAF01
MTAEKIDLPLRIVVDQPLPGVAIALARGNGANAALIAPVHASSDALVFDLDVTVDGNTAEGGPRFLGAFVQGPPTARYVYLNVGSMAGQIGSPWQRRVKIPLSGIGWEAIEALGAGSRLTAHIASKRHDGSPACATVPILPPGWSAS